MLYFIKKKSSEKIIKSVFSQRNCFYSVSHNQESSVAEKRENPGALFPPPKFQKKIFE
ncbi:hypothetical protein HMPREF1863_00447 [Aedoeadaptatus coxii]|uniref:Uncharacterized protein n=1 Tax=Aedoeadaptatus coxii TaxID=755172 RepID=A0A134AJ37_9FIRM|nr:hypothetical protein HMPREF1863_00447 [Peptoniphilus coxii]